MEFDGVKLHYRQIYQYEPNKNAFFSSYIVPISDEAVFTFFFPVISLVSRPLFLLALPLPALKPSLTRTRDIDNNFLLAI